MARCYYHLGAAEDETGNYQLSEEIHRKSLALCQTIGDTWGEAAALMNIGVEAETLGRYNEAEHYYQASHQRYQTIEHRLGIAQSLTNLGHLYERLENYEQAIEHYSKAAVIKRSLGDPVAIATTITNLADAYLAVDNILQARQLMDESLSLVYKANAMPRVNRVLWSYSQFFAKQKSYGMAVLIARHMLLQEKAEVWTREGAAKDLKKWLPLVSQAELEKAEGLMNKRTLEFLLQQLMSGVSNLETLLEHLD